MMNYVLRLTAAILAVAMLCAAMTSCYQKPPTVINPVDDTTATTEPQGPLKPTVSDVFVLNSTKLTWDELKIFEHTMTGDNTAHFDVVANNGNTCSLDVVIDTKTGLLTEATIRYKDMTQTLLTDNYLDLFEIIRAVNK